MDTIEAIKAYAIRQIGGPYVYGATGVRCTPAMREAQCDRYPDMAGSIRQHCPVLRGDLTACAGCRHHARLAFDCAQLTRRALEIAGMRPPSGATSQWRSGLFVRKGPLAQLPADSLCLLFRQEPGQDTMAHVGLYLGDGRVIDARSHKAGVVLSQLHDYPWTHYVLPSLPTYRKEPSPLTMGARGEAVRDLQRLLLHQGEQLPRYGVDGHFGRETLAALNAFQKRLGLPISAEAGPADLERLKTAPPRERPVSARLDDLERQLQLLLKRMPA